MSAHLTSGVELGERDFWELLAELLDERHHLTALATVRRDD